MASIPRVVYWRFRDEWLQVYRQLYSFDDPEAQKRGLDRVAAWTSRSGGKLPLAVENTANLISAHLGLATVEYGVQGRLMLAMALVRFVNGMADHAQKGMFARSVQSIADEIGLPDWLVDLRHQATHDSLPSMETLHCGVRVSLSWLRDQYWEAQLNIHNSSTEKLDQLISAYRDQAFSDRLKKEKKCKSKVTALAKQITNFVSSNNLWSFLPSVLSQEGLLVPSCEQLQILDVDWLTDGISENSPVPSVPVEVVSMWKTLLETLNSASSEFMPCLVVYLFDMLPETTDGQLNLISLKYAAWLHYLLQVLSKKKPGIELVHSFPWLPLLEISLERPTLFSLTFIPLIIDNIPAISPGLKQRIEQLVLLFTKPPNVNSKNSSKLPEIEDADLEKWLTNKKKSMPEKDDNNTETNSLNSTINGGWSIYQGLTQWHQIPLGEVLGTDDISPNNLELGQTTLAEHMLNPVYANSGSEQLVFSDPCTYSIEGITEEMLPNSKCDGNVSSDQDSADVVSCLSDYESGHLHEDSKRHCQDNEANGIADDGMDFTVFDSEISIQICIF